jgi:hypothetical protein
MSFGTDINLAIHKTSQTQYLPAESRGRGVGEIRKQKLQFTVVLL